MKTYKTTEVATIIGIHPNTVRLYEKLTHLNEENAYTQKNINVK